MKSLFAVLLILLPLACTLPPAPDRYGLAVRVYESASFETPAPKEIFTRVAGLYGRYYGQKTFAGRNELSEGRMLLSVSASPDGDRCRIDSVHVYECDFANSDFIDRVVKVMQKISEPASVDRCDYAVSYELVFSRNVNYSVADSLKDQYLFFLPLQRQGMLRFPFSTR